MMNSSLFQIRGLLSDTKSVQYSLHVRKISLESQPYLISPLICLGAQAEATVR